MYFLLRVIQFLYFGLDRMCYSAEVSIGTFSFVSVISLYLWFRNKKIDRCIALILFTISIMQFFEFILWTHPDCDEYNKAVSAVIPVYLFLQPAMFAFITWILGAGTGQYYPLIFLSSLPILLFRNYKTQTCIKPGEGGHLDWKLTEADNLLNFKYAFPDTLASLLYYGAIIYTIATLKSRSLSAIMLGLFGVTWFVESIRHKAVWGSIWCHSVNVAAVLAVFYQ